MAEETNSYGYDDVDKVAKTGKYLNFRKGDKGKIIQIRLASEPRYVQQHWISDIQGKQTPVNCTGIECPYCGDAVAKNEKLDKIPKWGWIVIDREDEEVKIFTGPTLIARAIKEISELKNIKTGKVMWGNPTTFDIQIERTELPGAGYYKVTPIVDGKGELTEEEKKKVEEAGFNLEEELQGSKKSDNTGSYGTQDLETAPETNKENPDASSIEVDPDDIPF